MAKKVKPTAAAEEQSPPAKTSLAEKYAAIENKYKKKGKSGGVVVGRAQDIKYAYDLRRPTTVLPLNIALAGGFPGGTICQIWGKDGAGKTWLCHNTCAMNQQIYGQDSVIVWASNAIGLDKSQARRSGVHIPYDDEEIASFVTYWRRQHGEDPPDEAIAALAEPLGDYRVVELFGNIYDGADTEMRFNVLLDIIESEPRPQIVVIDEAAGSLSTQDRMNKGLEDAAKTADQSHLIAEFLRKLNHHLKLRDEEGRPNEVTVLASVQRRMNLAMTGKYGKKEISPGGTSLSHAKVVDLYMQSGMKIRDSSDRVVGKQVKIRVEKGKLGLSEGFDMEVPFYFDREGFVDTATTLFEECKRQGLVRQSGRYWQIVSAQEEIYADKVAGGSAAVVDLLRRDPTLQANLTHDAMGVIRTPWRWR